MSSSGITKRGFIAGLAALATLGSSIFTRRAAAAQSKAGRSGAGKTGWAAQIADADLVVYNERYADARAFAQVHGERGIATLPMEGDAGVLWYAQLRGRIAAGQRRIAGVGTHTDFFILHTLAREAGLRVQTSTRLPPAHDHDGLLVSWTMA